MQVLLASASPRRKEILSSILNSGFEVQSLDVDESHISLNPKEIVVEVSKKKIEAVAKKEKYDLIISGDTIVWFNGRRFDKPQSVDAAKKMLKTLSGNTHEVISAVSILYKGRLSSRAESSSVTFKALTSSEIESYVSKYEVLDKAGAYGIQDNIVVESFKGSYTNIVGMPKEALLEMLIDLKLSSLLKGKV